MPHIPKKPKISFERRRRLIDEGTGPSTPQTEASNRLVGTLKVFEDADLVARKANTILEAIKKSSVGRTVPVDPGDTEVRAAVLRQDPPSNGEFITYELYLKSIAYSWAMVDFSLEEIRSIDSKFIPIAAKRLSELGIAKASGVSKKDARFMNSQAMYLYILQAMQMGMQALEAEKQTITKLPPGPEAIPVVLSIALSIAFNLSYSENLEEDFLSAMEATAQTAQAGNSRDFSKLLEEAKKADILSIRPMALSLKSKERGDLQLIKEYVRAFLARTRRLGYEPWLVAEETTEALQRSRRLLGKRKGWDSVSMPNELIEVLGHQNSRLSSSLDRIATFLTNKVSTEDVLCTLVHLSEIGADGRQVLEALLELFISEKARTFPYIPEPSLESNVLDEIVHDIAMALEKVRSKLIGLLPRDNELWAALETCTPLGEIISAALQSLDQLEERFISRLEDMVDRTRAIVSLINTKTLTGLEIKKIRMGLAQINQADSFVEDEVEDVESTANSPNPIDLSVFEDPKEGEFKLVEIKDDNSFIS